MADIEKVIKCLEACTGEQNDCAGHTCPYWDFDGEVGCRTQMELDALALLKEQEAVEPHHKCIGETYSLITESHVMYCPWCGRKIKKVADQKVIIKFM